jgi:adenylate cyclase
MSAILSADVKDYSRLMSADEEGTVKDLNACREIIAGCVADHRGRVVDSPGDNVLAEFASTVEAVKCAVQIQKDLKAWNADRPEDRRMEFRIGVNLGDVIEEEGRIYGDGVNIAARLEGLADAGGICISGTAFDQVKGKLPLGYQFVGEQTVKNIPDPVRAYKVLMDERDAGKIIGFEKKAPKGRWLEVAAVIFFVVIGLIIYQFYVHRPTVDPASVDKMAFPLPEQPSIAVLPFDNLTGDPDQEYFSDGLTEEIITGLSKVPDLFVIARNSSFIYKGKPVKVQQVSEELGVRYVLEGSVRKEGNRVRITAQLIDAISGRHMWSKRYDRELNDIFELQDEIMRDILIEMRVQLTEGVQIRGWHTTYHDKKINMEAYWKQMQSRWHFFRMDPEGFAMSKQLAEEAVKIEPNWYAPYTLLAYINQRNLPLSEKYARKALELNDSAPMANITMGQIYLKKRQWDKAIALGERALALDPNGAEVHNHFGYILNESGRFEEAIPFMERAFRLDPYPPSFYYYRLGLAYFYVGRYDDTVKICEKGLERNPRDLFARIILIAGFIGQGREDEVRAEAKKVLKVYPEYSIRQAKANSTQKNKVALNRFYAAMAKAGLPE